MATCVVNLRYESCNVYIGRPSKWGNPFQIGHGRTRQQAIEQYREWILQQPELLAALPELRDRRLGCYCAPLLCHGDVLLELIDGLERKGA